MRCFRVLPSRKLHGDKSPGLVLAHIVNGAVVGMVGGSLSEQRPGIRHLDETPNSEAAVGT